MHIVSSHLATINQDVKSLGVTIIFHIQVPGWYVTFNTFDFWPLQRNLKKTRHPWHPKTFQNVLGPAVLKLRRSQTGNETFPKYMGT